MKRVIDPRMDIGGAIRALKAGKRVRRIGWGRDNSPRNQWLTLSMDDQPRRVPAESLWSPHNRAHALRNGGYATVLPCITHKTTDGAIQMGWSPSQEDLLADDWIAIEEEPT